MGKNLSPQQRQVVEYLRLRGSITTLEATRMSNPICRLSERIRELEGIGWKFEHAVPDKRKHYTRYILLDTPVQQMVMGF